MHATRHFPTSLSNSASPPSWHLSHYSFPVVKFREHSEQYFEHGTHLWYLKSGNVEESHCTQYFKTMSKYSKRRLHLEMQVPVLSVNIINSGRHSLHLVPSFWKTLQPSDPEESVVLTTTAALDGVVFTLYSMRTF